MRHAAAACLVAAVVAGCGAQKRAHEVPARLIAPRECHVSVFLATRMVTGREATRAEIAALRERLSSSSKVKTFAFVGSPSNPLPSAYEVVPRSAEDARALAAELRRATGVEHVSAAKSC
jgi:nitrous oxide reductase accessory protein NosL